VARSRLSKKAAARRLDLENAVQSAYRSLFGGGAWVVGTPSAGRDLWRVLFAIGLHKLHLRSGGIMTPNALSRARKVRAAARARING
jgi:hypothetical protein